jgi:hypothetical protein
LRIKDDDVIGFSPRIISGIPEKEVVDSVNVLLAPVESDVKAAGCGRG